MDRNEFQALERLTRAVEKVGDELDEMNEHLKGLDEPNIVTPSKEEEIIADALRMDDEQNLADK